MTGESLSATSSLWDGDLFQLNKEEKGIRLDFQNFLRSSPCDLGHYLADVNKESPAGNFDRGDVSILERLIVRSCSKRPDKALRLGILGKVVYQLNRCYQKSIPPPRYALSMKPEPNPFPPSDGFPSLNCEAHELVRLCLSIEREWIASLSPIELSKIENRRQNVPPELIVFSAALYGGIVDLDLAVAMFDALVDPGKSFSCSSATGRFYSDLLVSSQGLADQETRRWYPDDTLVCLIARVSPTSRAISDITAAGDASDMSLAERRNLIADAIWSAVTAEFRRQQSVQRNYDARHLPSRLKDLFANILIVIHSELPSILAEYAARKVDCRSLLPASIGRIYGDPAIARQAAPQSEDEEDALESEEEADFDDEEAYGGKSPSDAEPAWLPDLRKALAGEDLKKISERLNRLLEDDQLQQPRQRFCAFALRLVERGTTYGNKLRPTSLRCCALTAARRAGRVLGEKDPATYSSATLETLYLRVIDDAALDSPDPRRLKRRVTWALREFQRFLVSKCGAETINEAEVFRSPRGLLPVDARIISIDDINNALSYLDQKRDATNDPERKSNIQTAQAEIVFGFFAGLRRMEGLGMPWVDYIEATYPEVLVRTTKARALKTANATRRIPLGWATLPFPQFLEFPRAAQEKLAQENRKASNNRIAKDVLFFATASDDIIIPIIHDALQAVTGDTTIHYHTLRHSFCCWTFLRLMLSELPEAPNLFPQPGMELTMEWLRASKEFRHGLYRNSIVTNDHLWYVSTLMGHAYPRSSLSNYIHILDLLLPLYLRQSEVFGERSDSEFRQALGLGKQSYKVLPLRDGEGGQQDSDPSPAVFDDSDAGTAKPRLSVERHGLRAAIAAKRFRLRFRDGAPVVANCEVSTPGSWLDQTWCLLEKCGRAGRTEYFPILNSGFEPEDAAKILNRAAAFSKLMTLKDTYRHLTIHQRSDADKNTMARGCCPAKPHANSTKAQVARLAAEFDKIRGSHAKRIRTFLDYFARNVLPGSCRVVFTKPFDQSVIETYIKVLFSMGLPGIVVLYRSRDGGKNPHPGATFLANCGIPADATVENVTDGRSDPYLPVEGLSIEPDLSAQSATANQQRKFWEEFRFVLLMAAIAHG